MEEEHFRLSCRTILLSESRRSGGLLVEEDCRCVVEVGGRHRMEVQGTLLGVEVDIDVVALEEGDPDRRSSGVGDRRMVAVGRVVD